MVEQWQKAKIPPYNVTIAGLPSQIAYGGWKKSIDAMTAI